MTEIQADPITGAFAITTLGCKVNQYESNAIARRLIDAGWTAADRDGHLDLHIINTCAVTGRAAMQGRGAVRRAIRNHPDARIVVTGCYAQIDPSAFQKISGVHDIIGHPDKHRIAEILTRPGSEPPPRMVVGDVGRERAFPDYRVTAHGGRGRPVLKVQDGCDAFCTYCIVPHARGRSRSMLPATVIDHLRRLSARGFREAVLSGIHLGAYGQDFSPAVDLAELLDAVAAARPITRVRLSSIEPLELTDEIIGRVADADVFCPHFHIPLQSGDNEILARMHRPYTVEAFRDRVRRIREALPQPGGAAIGVDVLAGFPGESESAFANTCRCIEALPVSYLHVFPFSPRPGTPAARYGNRVPDAEIRKRCRIIRSLGEAKRTRFYREQVGTETTVLVLQRTGPDRLTGIGGNYLPVELPGWAGEPGDLVSVRVVAAEGGAVTGVPIKGSGARNGRQESNDG